MNQKPAVSKIGIYEYHPEQRERFKTGELVEEWYKRYPTIFDEQDSKIALHQSPKNYHFFEWLSAITLYQTLGFNSLVEQYEFRTHTRKQEILRKMLPDDLFVYPPDYSEWFFCEAKGLGDKLS